MLDADVGEMVDPCSPRSPCCFRLLRHRSVFDRWQRRLRLVDKLGDLEEMALARVVSEAFVTTPEDVAAQQGQGLG